MATPVVIDAEYDGKHFVPDQNVGLSPGQRVRLVSMPATEPTPTSREERLQRYWQMIERFRNSPIDVSLTDEQLRREHLYEDE